MMQKDVNQKKLSPWEFLTIHKSQLAKTQNVKNTLTYQRLWQNCCKCVANFIKPYKNNQRY